MTATTKSSYGQNYLTGGTLRHHQHLMGVLSDIKQSVELMYPSKGVAVIVHHNKKGNLTK